MPLSAVLAVRNGRVPDAANQVNECGALTLTGLGYNQGRRPGGQTGGNIGTNWGAGTAPWDIRRQTGRIGGPPGWPTRPRIDPGAYLPP